MWDILSMKGIASRVRRDQEGAASVLRFVITAENGTRVTVEMRGQEIRGVLDDGDRVVLMLNANGAPADGVHRPLAVENQTTGSTVTAWRPSLAKRMARPLLITLSTAAISSGVTFLFELLVGGGPTSVDMRVPGAGTDWFPFDVPDALFTILATSAFLWIVWFALFGWRRQRRGHRTWPVAPGLVLGVSIGLWAFAIVDGSTIR